MERSRKRSHSSKDKDSKKHKTLRSGKWTYEEEVYANRLIVEFEGGHLEDCEDGCTLRAYLARKLNCAPMRISKKFAGRCIGKLVFVRRPRKPEVEGDETPLVQLEEEYHRSCQQVDEGMRGAITSCESSSDDGLDTKDSDVSETEVDALLMNTTLCAASRPHSHDKLIKSEPGACPTITQAPMCVASEAEPFDFDDVTARAQWWGNLPEENLALALGLDDNVHCAHSNALPPAGGQELWQDCAIGGFMCEDDEQLFGFSSGSFGLIESGLEYVH